MFSSFGYTEMLLFGIIALMLFGGKLPDVARNFGRTYRDLRRKVDDLQREFREWDKPEVSQKPNKTLQPYHDSDQDRYAPLAPKFIPPNDDEEESERS